MCTPQPNLLSTDGTASLATAAFSKGQGAYYAYGISLSGSDFCTIYVRSTSSPLAEREVDGKVVKMEHHADRLPEEIRFVKFSSIVWTHDEKGFFYQVCSINTLWPLRVLGTANDFLTDES